MNTEKIVVSPFEFAIREIAEPETIDNYRPETALEKQKRREKKEDEFLDRIMHKTEKDVQMFDAVREEIKRMGKPTN